MKSINAEALVSAASKASERERNAWKLIYNESEEIPKGFRRWQEWARIWGKSEHRFNILRILKILVGKGKMEKTFVKIKNSRGYLRRTPIWKLK